MQFKQDGILHILILEGEGEMVYGDYSFPVGKYSSILALEDCCEFTLKGNFEYLKTTAQR